MLIKEAVRSAWRWISLADEIETIRDQRAHEVVFHLSYLDAQEYHRLGYAELNDLTGHVHRTIVDQTGGCPETAGLPLCYAIAEAAVRDGWVPAP